MINRHDNVHGWCNRPDLQDRVAYAPDQDQRKSFEEARRAVRKRQERSPSQEQMASPGNAGAYMPPWMMLGNEHRSQPDQGSAATGTIGAAAGADAAGAMGAPAPALLQFSGNHWSGRLVGGPWSGLEIHAALHAGALTMTLRPASRQQHENLLKMTGHTVNAKQQKDATDVSWSFPVRWEVAEYAAVD